MKVRLWIENQPEAGHDCTASYLEAAGCCQETVRDITWAELKKIKTAVAAAGHGTPEDDDLGAPELVFGVCWNKYGEVIPYDEDDDSRSNLRWKEITGEKPVWFD